MSAPSLSYPRARVRDRHQRNQHPCRRGRFLDIFAVVLFFIVLGAALAIGF